MAKKELVQIYCENCGEKMMVGKSHQKDKDGSIKEKVDNFVALHKGHTVRIVRYRP